MTTTIVQRIVTHPVTAWITIKHQRINRVVDNGIVHDGIFIISRQSTNDIDIVLLIRIVEVFIVTCRILLGDEAYANFSVVLLFLTEEGLLRLVRITACVVELRDEVATPAISTAINIPFHTIAFRINPDTIVLAVTLSITDYVDIRILRGISESITIISKVVESFIIAHEATVRSVIVRNHRV